MTELRQLQLTELRILKELDLICKKHNITYYLDSGTLLGAVRHQGFIPWDDDIDVAMPFDDYKRFLAIAQHELSSDFFIQNSVTDPNFYRTYTRIRLNNTTMMQRHHTKYRIHQGIWLDIFPIIGFNSRFEYSIKKCLVKIVHILQMDNYIAANETEFRGILGKKFFLLKFLYKVPFQARAKLHAFILRRISSPANKKYAAHLWCTLGVLCPSDYFIGEPQHLQFEDGFYPVPSKYKERLTAAYGDYMKLPPEEDRKGHGDLIIDLNNSYEMYLDTSSVLHNL